MTGPPTDNQRSFFPGFRIRVVGTEERGVTAEQIGLFLFDFSVAFELFRRIVQEGERRPRLTRWDLFRGRKRVGPIERLVVERLRMESPVEFIATTIALSAAGAGAIWAAIQAFERIYMLPTNRLKAELEVEKLKLEVKQLREEQQLPTMQERIMAHSVVDQIASDSREHRRYERYDETDEVIYTVERRLRTSAVQVKEIEFDFDRHLPPPRG